MTTIVGSQKHVVLAKIGICENVSAYPFAFGQVVRELRKNAQLSQERLGFLAKLSRVYVGEIERGEKTPTLDAVAALARALGKPAHELIADAEKRV
jgi:transcriptional regulator with XRE-family HTH domain